MPQDGDDRISVRLQPADREALDWLTGYLLALAPPGVGIEQSDVVRWALHTCRAGLETGDRERCTNGET